MGFDWALSSAYAATTIWHRLSWFGAAAAMTQAERQAETARMVGEKVAAAYEGGAKAGLEAMRTMWGIALGAKPSAAAHAAIADAAHAARVPQGARQCQAAEAPGARSGRENSHHRAVSPPSMTNSAPVTKRDSSDSR